ncbi:hypothetical protein GCM10010151_51400 [Actinoallomurus spadix]|uniref:Uncharacterized protein n=1 Tax=Actinoallomurus spadix TaxID=79912 RepID=A0ABN0X5W1_9ACTN
MPTIASSWVGGDIQGLSGLSQVIFNFAENSAGPVADLRNAVDRLVRESGDPVYPGSAVSEFKTAFSQELNDINWLSQRATSIGEIVDNLALNLAKIESWLEKQAEKGVAAGHVTIDRSGNMQFPNGTSMPEVQSFLQDFNQCRSQALAAAEKARQVAAKKLSSEYKLLSAGLANYRNNHKNLLSQNEEKSLGSHLVDLDKRFRNLQPKHGSWAHAAAGAGIGATVGGGIGFGVGAVVGLLGGPFAEVTVPAGAATGNAVGNGIGTVVGGLIGWAW